MRLFLLFVFLASVSVESSQAQVYLAPLQGLPALDRPVDIQDPPSDDRVYVVEVSGRIISFDRDNPGNTAVFLDITDRVITWNIEDGLLGLAFHPNYEANGYFFVYFTTRPNAGGVNHRTVLSRFSRSEDNPLEADPESEVVFLDFEQPSAGHNGGQIAFGANGDLYLSMGDGDSMGLDPGNLAQNRSVPFGSILRLDVDTPSGDKNYSIPADNPFINNDNGWLEEIWAWGLRNPWRFSIDPQTGWLWVGDVGSGAREEISIIREGGTNLGWDVMEGFFCFGPDPATEPECDDPSLLDPIWDYWQSGGNAVTGGYLYRGTAVPALTGKYVYGDFVSGKIWALTYEEGSEPVNEEILQHTLVSSFGLGALGELYVLSYGGQVSRLSATPVSTESSSSPASASLSLAGPNPFQDQTSVLLASSTATYGRLTLYDALGREVAMLFEGPVSAGLAREVRVGGSGLSSGTYFIQFEAEDGTVTRSSLTVVR